MSIQNPIRSIFHIIVLRTSRIDAVKKQMKRRNKDELEFLPLTLELQESPPSPLKRVTLWTITALFFTFFFWVTIGKIDVVSTVSGRIIPAGRIKTVQAPAEGTIVALHVVEGQYVKRGDPILQLDAAVANADAVSTTLKLAFTKAQLIRLKSEINNKLPDYGTSGASSDVIAVQETLRVSRSSSLRAHLSEAENIYESRKHLLRAAEEKILPMINALKAAKEKEERVRPYVGTVMPRFDYLNLKSIVEQSEGNLEVQKKYVQDAFQQAAAAKQRIEQIRMEESSKINTEINDSTSQIINIESSIEKTRKALVERIVRAPIDGHIQNLTVTTLGGVVSFGKPIATIVPTNSNLIIEAILPNEDIGFAYLGQNVDVKIDTYPSQIYGSLAGQVSDLSPDAENSQESLNAEGAATSRGPSNFRGSYNYRVKIKLDHTWININGIRKQLVPGMTVQADIVTDRRRIIHFFSQPIVKSLESGMKVR